MSDEHPTHREFTRVLAGVQVSVETPEGSVVRAETQNVSMKGTLVLTAQRLPLDTPCEVTLHLDHGAVEIRARGRVARLYSEGIAIEFDKIDGLESYEHLIRPGIGKIKTDALTHAQVARWHHDLRNTPRKANYALAVLRKMMNLAATWGFREKSNPCTGIKKFPESTRDRIPTMEELTRIWETFDKAKKENWASPFALACLQVILLTGSRKTVIRTLRWDHVDMEAGFIRLPANTEGSKAKEAISIALPPQAIEVLTTLPHFLGTASKFVFPGNNPGSATGCVDSLWFRIREEAKVPDLRIHDLRHLWGTTAGALNFQGPMIQASLNHKTPATTSRYVNLKDAAKKEVATAVGIALSHVKRKTAES